MSESILQKLQNIAFKNSHSDFDISNNYSRFHYLKVGHTSIIVSSKNNYRRVTNLNNETRLQLFSNL